MDFYWFLEAIFFAPLKKFFCCFRWNFCDPNRSDCYFKICKNKLTKIQCCQIVRNFAKCPKFYSDCRWTFRKFRARNFSQKRPKFYFCPKRARKWPKFNKKTANFGYFSFGNFKLFPPSMIVIFTFLSPSQNCPKMLRLWLNFPCQYLLQWKEYFSRKFPIFFASLKKLSHKNAIKIEG